MLTDKKVTRPTHLIQTHIPVVSQPCSDQLYLSALSALLCNQKNIALFDSIAPARQCGVETDFSSGKLSSSSVTPYIFIFGNEEVEFGGLKGDRCLTRYLFIFFKGKLLSIQTSKYHVIFFRCLLSNTVAELLTCRGVLAQSPQLTF